MKEWKLYQPKVFSNLIILIALSSICKGYILYIYIYIDIKDLYKYIIFYVYSNEITDDGLCLFADKVLQTQKNLHKLKLVLIGFLTIYINIYIYVSLFIYKKAMK